MEISTSGAGDKMKTVGRQKDGGLVYLRRSSGKQETSLDTQLAWANRAACEHGVVLDATPADLHKMQAATSHTYKAIRLDDSISGADHNRPGFQALLNEAETDETISRRFIYKRDRNTRPEEAMAFAQREKDIVQSGITIVLSD